MEISILDSLPKTPMWEQYIQVKRQALDSLLLYRMGDFYELFLDDATTAASILGITLTARNKNEGAPIPMCGFPFHSATLQINKLLAAGQRVAICEQTEDASAVKGLVKREIVRIVSPGMAFDADTLAPGENNFLLVLELLANPEKTLAGAYSALDLSTGTWLYGQFSSCDSLRDELALIQPREVLAGQSQIGSPLWLELERSLGRDYFSCLTPVPDFFFDNRSAYTDLCAHFGLLNLESFSLRQDHPAMGAVGAAFRRAKDTQKLANLSHLQSPKPNLPTQFLQLDESTIDHLDLFPKPGQSPQDSLFFHLDRTTTSMGARKLRELIARPLAAIAAIQERQLAIRSILENYAGLKNLRELLTGMRDLERLLAKVGLRSANPRDLVGLLDALNRIPALKQTLHSFSSSLLLQNMERSIHDFQELRNYLAPRLKEEPPATTREGQIFRTGFNAELDELIRLTEDGKSFLIDLEQKEREKTGIQSLKVKYNKIFGYFIEVTAANLASVPANYIRKQTMAGGERFITEELKTFEDKILRAQDKRIALEEALFAECLDQISQYSQRILSAAQEIALLDSLQSLAICARENSYCQPEVVSDSHILDIVDGRHPALEQLVGKDRFISNNCLFDSKAKIHLLTGPNMAGKSTYMRQVALISLLAHMGAFVPAKKAKIGLIDRIATRVGASDRIGRGQSTFMVEMNEMARILRQASEKSLLIIDEIGRGTSTYDGLALAWAIVGDIQSRIGARTLFATHYHELTKLEGQLQGVLNYSVLVEERAGDILFLHKVALGKAPGSYGVQVAKLAGLPANIIEQARSILQNLEQSAAKKADRAIAQSSQLSLFDSSPKIVKEVVKEIPMHMQQLESELLQIDLDQTTPLNALIALRNLKDKVNQNKLSH